MTDGNGAGATVPDGIDAEGVAGWFAEHVPGAVAPLTYQLIAGGHSNLTYSVTDATGQKFVLRRPPLGQVLATAHDMGREHTIIAALAGTDVPVAPVHGLCTDESVNGAPFYVMDFVDGTVVRSQTEADSLTVAQRQRAGESLVEVLAAIHSVDVDAVGLGDLGRKEAYVERQLKRWYGQFQKSEEQVEGGLNLPSVHAAHAALSAGVPEQGPAAIVHGVGKGRQQPGVLRGVRLLEADLHHRRRVRPLRRRCHGRRARRAGDRVPVHAGQAGRAHGAGRGRRRPRQRRRQRLNERHR